MSAERLVCDTSLSCTHTLKAKGLFLKGNMFASLISFVESKSKDIKVKNLKRLSCSKCSSAADQKEAATNRKAVASLMAVTVLHTTSCAHTEG